MTTGGRATAPATKRVYALAAAVATVAACVALGPVSALSPLGGDHPQVPWFVFALAFAASEIFLIHIEHRREAVSISLSTVPLIVGLYTADPAGLVLARVIGSAAALVLHRRQAPFKLAINLAQMALEVGVAILVFRMLLPAGVTTGVATWPAALASAVAGDALQSTILISAISLYQRKWEGGLGASMAFGSVARLVDTAVALVIVSVLEAEPAAVALLAIATGVLGWSYRAHVSLRAQHRQLGQLYEFTGRVSNAMLGERVVESVLDEARELLHADTAWVHVVVDGAERRIVLTSDGDVATEQPVTSGEAIALHQRVQSEARVILTDGGRILAAPLRAAGAVLGTLAVADRRGEVRQFSADDFQMFATLANHAGVALANDDLLDRLRREAADNEHKSLHDALTDLPNRTLFARTVDEALARGETIAVLLLDLDRFKDVNDTLGHQAGDVLLQHVAKRLRASLRHGDTIARLGGDEFACLLPDVGGSDAAVATARALVSAVERPFPIGDVSVDVGASIGVAIAPDHGVECSVLLQRADIAMYAAKGDQSGVELYDAERDPHTPERLAVVSELRAAIASGGLKVHYQPQVDLATGEVIGVESLVRWDHPRRGRIAPDEFVPVAERTGLIEPLTRYVLETAIHDCARLRAHGGPGRVSVNLSAKNLLEATIVDDVMSMLRSARLPASALCLELTETSIMRDPRRTISALHRFADLGITIAVDDFGTGHSSLAYLKQLPVGEIKIDKSFVLGMQADRHDEAIVYSIAQLAANLGIPVVAEGVEDDELARRLLLAGCGVGQGFGFSPALPAPDLVAWLARRAAPARTATPIR